jgi:Phytanoyl-CoA dioxygenase (PhyH)
MLAWYVDPRGHSADGFAPHRDRQPDDAAASFRADGSAKLATAWVPLTDAAPENSCLYAIPRQHDPGYLAGAQLSSC